MNFTWQKNASPFSFRIKNKIATKNFIIQWATWYVQSINLVPYVWNLGNKQLGTLIYRWVTLLCFSFYSSEQHIHVIRCHPKVAWFLQSPYLNNYYILSCWSFTLIISDDAVLSSQTTCSLDAFKRGSGQKIVGFSLYGDYNSKKR